MSGPIIGAILIFGFIALYFITYIGNSSTKAPEGAEVISKCSTCGSGSCSVKLKEEYMSSNEECELYETK